MKIDFGRVLYALPGLVWTALPDGRIDFVNRQWAEYTGVGLDEAHGSEWQSIVHPDDMPALRDWWLSMSALSEPAEMEIRLRRFDGSHRRFLVRCSPLFDDQGGVDRWCGVGTDVESLYPAEESRLEQALTFQRVVDSIPMPVAVTAPSGAVEWLNRPTLDYFGKTLEDLKGWSASDVVHPDDLQRTLAAQLDAHHRGNSYDVESRHKRADGVYRWFNVLGLPLRDPEGHILRWFHLLIDIDDRKRVEEALRHTEQQSRIILDNIATLVSLLDANGKPELINRQIIDYTGKTEEELKQWGGNDLVHPDDIANASETFKAGVKSGTAFDIVYRMRRFDGAYRWFHGRHRPLTDSAGRVERWCVSVDDIDDRKRIEESLRSSEKSLQTTIDTIPALVWSARTDGTAEFFNRHYLEYVGQNLEDVQDWGWIAAVHPDDLDRLKSVWVATMAAGGRGECEARIMRFDGVHRWFLFRVDPLRDEHGTIVRWYGINTDIEEQKRAEQALAASELDARLMVNSIDAMIALFTPEGVLNGGNRQLLDYFKLPLEEVMNWASNGITHPDDLQHCIDTFMASIASGEPYDFETRFRRFDGVFRWFQIRGLPHRDASGRIVRWYGLLTDIDDRKRAEEALRRSEMLLAEGQRISLAGTFSWLLDTDTLTFSEQMHSIFEFEPSVPVTFEGIQSRVHPDDLGMLAEKMAEVRSGRDNEEYDIRLLMRDGRLKHLRVFGRIIEHPTGLRECLGAVQDVTQRRLAEQAHDELRSELAHVTRVMSLGAMAASIAHEVNQPLSGIITNASTSLRMLAADPPNLEGARETARRTIRDGNRAADVITRLRALFGRRLAPVEVLDLNDAVREVVALCWSDLQRARVSLRTELIDGIPTVQGDRVQIQQVVMNLLRNAADAMDGIEDRPRQIVLRTEVDDDDGVRLSVRDAGTGIDPAYPDRIFDPFYTTKSNGMGIGLSVSRTIIESHGGRLWVEANDGPGATFAFSIPNGSTGLTTPSLREEQNYKPVIQ